MTLPERNRLIEQYLPLVWKIVNRLWSIMGLRQLLESRYDAYQKGVIGLIKAADGYDAEHRSGAKFISYAYAAIRNEIFRESAETNLIHVPAYLLHDGQRPTKEKKRESWDGFRPLAKLALRPRGVPDKYDAMDKHENDEPGESLDRQYQLERLAQAMRFLDQRDREIVELYFGLRAEPEALWRIGARYGISRNRVLTRKRRACDRLRCLLADLEAELYQERASA